MSYFRLFMLLWILSSMEVNAFSQKISQTVQAKKLIEHNSVLFFKDDVLNGCVRIKYDNKKIEITNFKDGLRDGKSIVFNEKKIKEQGFYQKNRKEGEWISYNNEKPWRITNYTKGLKEGKQVTMGVLGGKSKIISHFINDTLNGWQSSYSYLGNLELEVLYNKGEHKQSISFFEDGSIKDRCNWKNGEKKCVRYQRSTHKQKDYEILDSIFYCNNKLSKIQTFVNDSLEIEIDMRVEEDTIKTNRDKIVIINLIKQTKRQKTYIIYLDRFSMFYNKLDYWEDYILRSYKSFYSTSQKRLVNSFPNSCNMYEYLRLMSEPVFFDFYEKDKKGQLFKLSYYEGSDDELPGCIKDIIKNK